MSRAEVSAVDADGNTEASSYIKQKGMIMNVKSLTLFACSLAFLFVVSDWITPASAAPIGKALWAPDALPLAGQARDRDRDRDGDCDQDADQDQTRDRDQDRDGDCCPICDGEGCPACGGDQDQTRDRARDGSCQSALPWTQDTRSFAKRDRKRDRDKDCNGDRRRDRRRDGSCQNA